MSMDSARAASMKPQVLITAISASQESAPVRCRSAAAAPFSFSEIHNILRASHRDDVYFSASSSSHAFPHYVKKTMKSMIEEQSGDTKIRLSNLSNIPPCSRDQRPRNLSRRHPVSNRDSQGRELPEDAHDSPAHDRAGIAQVREHECLGHDKSEYRTDKARDSSFPGFFWG